MSSANETLRWPTNLDRAAIVGRLTQVIRETLGGSPRAKGSSYQAAVRALAFKWIRILYSFDGVLTIDFRLLDPLTAAA